MLLIPFPESSLNEEAGREFMDNYDLFFKHAKVFTEVHARPNATQKAIMEERARKDLEEAKKDEKKNVAQITTNSLSEK